MQRVRRAVVTALALVLALGLTSGPAARWWFAPAAVAAADVAWPPSTLVVSELQTGGTSASDEFVEIANQGTGPVDLIGLEVVYATSSGSTVTRKATWTSSSILAPGRRVLLANSAGAFAGIGDAPYAGGFAATGGALALRVVGGDVVDAIGWGDATNTFVEGTVASAPPPGSSLERRAGWRIRQRYRHERQRRRLGRVVHAEPTGAGFASGPGSGPVADSRALADPGPDGRAESDDQPSRRPRSRHRHRSPPRRSSRSRPHARCRTARR